MTPALPATSHTHKRTRDATATELSDDSLIALQRCVFFLPPLKAAEIHGCVLNMSDSYPFPGSFNIEITIQTFVGKVHVCIYNMRDYQQILENSIAYRNII